MSRLHIKTGLLVILIGLSLSACKKSKVTEEEPPKAAIDVPAVDTSVTLAPPAPKPIAPVLEKRGAYTVDTARDCDGYPRMKLSTPEGLCIGLVVSAETPNTDGSQGLKFPRDIVFPRPEHKFSDEFYLTDMGGWSENRGRVLLYTFGKGLETAIQGLNLPHAIEYGPDNHIYVAEADQLIAFKPPPAKYDGFGYNSVITNLPYKPGGQKHLHPLKAFTFSDDNTLWINSGSLSDRCLSSVPQGWCQENEDTAAVLNFRKNGRFWEANPGDNVRGLRNSMGLAAHRSGTVLQVENGADFKDAGSPYEEINRIDVVEGKPRFYGWPYCFDRDLQDPVWGPAIGFNCSTHNPDYRQPIALLPPHGAPLDLLYAQAGTLNFDTEQLIVPLHGYRETAHRILYFDVDAEGLPVGDAKELVFDWTASETGPRGAPVGLTVGPDGAIWGVEDKNKTVFRIAVDQYPPQDWNDTSIAKPVAMDPAYPDLQARIFKPSCAACHTEFSGPPEQSFQALHQIGWLDADSNFYSRLIAEPPKQMPPDKPLSAAEMNAVKAWLDSLD